jgi:hypothetical protein
MMPVNFMQRFAVAICLLLPLNDRHPTTVAPLAWRMKFYGLVKDSAPHRTVFKSVYRRVCANLIKNSADENLR